jgi:hypothetical protein
MAEIAHQIIADLKWDFSVTYEKDAGRRYSYEMHLATIFV